MKQALSHLILAYCSHSAFISKQELPYHVMNLPVFDKSFPAVDVVGFYKRANIKLATDEYGTMIEYELVEFGKTTMQTTFFDLPTEK